MVQSQLGIFLCKTGWWNYLPYIVSCIWLSSTSPPTPHPLSIYTLFFQWFSVLWHLQDFFLFKAKKEEHRSLNKLQHWIMFLIKECQITLAATLVSQSQRIKNLCLLRDVSINSYCQCLVRKICSLDSLPHLTHLALVCHRARILDQPSDCAGKLEDKHVGPFMPPVSIIIQTYLFSLYSGLREKRPLHCWIGVSCVLLHQYKSTKGNQATWD